MSLWNEIHLDYSKFFKIFVLQNQIPVDLSTKIRVSDRLRSVMAEAWSFVEGRGMRLVTLVTPLIWVSNDIVFFGVIFNANNFYPLVWKKIYYR